MEYIDLTSLVFKKIQTSLNIFVHSVQCDELVDGVRLDEVLQGFKLQIIKESVLIYALQLLLRPLHIIYNSL